MVAVDDPPAGATEAASTAADAGAADAAGALRAALAPLLSPGGFGRFQWASAALSSRSFGDAAAMSGRAPPPGDGLGIMVPLLDMLNHDPEGAHVEWLAPAAQPSSGIAGDPAAEVAASAASAAAAEAPAAAWVGEAGASVVSAVSMNAHPRAVLRRPVGKGEQVLTHYGTDRSNVDLLVNYG